MTRRLTATWLLVMLTIPFASELVMSPLDWDFSYVLPGSREHFLSGKVTTKLEAQMKERSALFAALSPVYNELVYRATGRTLPTIHVGRDGWLFLSERVLPLSASRYGELHREIVVAVDRAARELDALNVDLVVAIVPDRARMYPRRAYPSGRLPEHKDGFMPELVRDLRAHGHATVWLVDALRALEDAGTRAFYRADHHWTSSGAVAAAVAIANLVRAEFPGHLCVPGERFFEPRWYSLEKPGSLVSKLGFLTGGRLERGFAERLPNVAYPRRIRRHGTAPRHSYLTTSYGQYGSPQHFANELGCDIEIQDGTARGSGWSLATHLAARRRIGRADVRRLAVWEITEYDLYSTNGTPSAIENLQR
jgi:hypothetical protein